MILNRVDAFSFFVEPSFSGNDVWHDDEDDVDESMNNHFLDIMRTSLMTCLMTCLCLLVGIDGI